jgi:RNA polymerase sigma-70 factor (ECF subfamily)
MDTAEEKALVQRLLTMDGTAWETLCKEHSPPLLAFVQLTFGCSREQAEDVVQMTFLRCVRSISSFDAARGRLLPWLKAVARNEVHTCLGKEARTPAQVPLSCVPGHVADQILDALDGQPLPQELLARQDVQMAIRQALMALNPRQREALVCKYIEGMTMSEIASLMNISEKAVESILSRSRASFRNVFLREDRDHEQKIAEAPNERA